MSCRGIDISGSYVDKIIIVDTGMNDPEVCSKFMDAAWKAAVAAQNKRKDAKIVQGLNLPSFKLS
jgi:hypothetical protein